MAASVIDGSRYDYTNADIRHENELNDKLGE